MIRIKARSFAGTAAVSGLLLSGCLGPRSDPSQFFVLTSLPETDTPPSVSSPASSGISLGLGPVTFPSYLERAEIVTRVTPNRVELSGYARWAVSLEKDFVEKLGENLSLLLAIDQIATYPWYSSTAIDYAVQIDVLRFERTSSGGAELLCRWFIKDVASGETLEARDSKLQEPADSADMEASVAALSRTVAGLSREISAAIQRIEGERRPAASGND